MTGKYSWTRQETKDLITLYEVNECLWNKNLREYRDRDERVSSIQSISDEMKIGIDEINKKIHNLRNQYRFEYNKMKKIIPGKPKYITKWPYYDNLNFLENIISVRGSQGGNNDGNETTEFTVEKFDEENETYEKGSKSDDNLPTTTIVSTSGDANNQSQQVFHVQVEYEETKPKTKVEVLQNTRKRTRMLTKDAIEITTQPTIPQKQQQPQVVYLEEKLQYQDVNDSIISESPPPKVSRRGNAGGGSDETLDQFDVFGRLVANELRQLPSAALQSKFKKKILQILLDMNDD